MIVHMGNILGVIKIIHLSNLLVEQWTANGENGQNGNLVINVVVEEVNEDSELVIIHHQDPMERNAKERESIQENATHIPVQV